MYCKHCGKQIIEDSIYCCFCGCKQDSIKSNNDSNDTNEKLPFGIEEEHIEENIQREEKIITISNWSYLGRRLIGTLFDKAAIIFISILLVFAIGSLDFDFFGDIGIYSALFHMSTGSVYNSAIGHVMANYPNELWSHHKMEIDEFFSYLLRIELKITSLFVLIYIIYYFWLESALGVSIGKYLFRLKLINSSSNTYQKITILKVTMRAIFVFVMASLIIMLRWLLGFNYYIAIVLFFLVLDFPVLFCKKSLIDIVTCTKLVHIPRTVSYSSKMNSCIKKESNMHYINSFTSIKRNRIVWCVCLIISALSVHKILSYYLADYYNPYNYNTVTNEYNNKGSDNYSRIYLTDNYVEYPLERYAVNRFIKHEKKTKTTENELDSTIGPLPVGIFMQTVKYNCSEEYIDGYKTIKKQYWRGSSDNGRYVDYDEYIPINRQYNYKNSISTFQLQDYKHSFTGDDYGHYYDEMEKRIDAENCKYEYTNVKGHKAIAYYTKYTIPTKIRVIVFANERAYLLETESTRALEEHSKQFCSDISFDFYHQKDGYITMLYTYIFLIVICSFCICINIYVSRNRSCNNRYAYSMYVFGILSFIINFTIASYHAYVQFVNKDLTVFSACLFIGALISMVFISTPLSVFYYKKSRTHWEYDYIVPSYLRKRQFDKIERSVNKRSYVMYICYPLMIISLLPLGVYIVVLYCIPIIFVVTCVIWFNKWQNWVKHSKG